MPTKDEVKKIKEESCFYQPCSQFSRTLRAWLVAYGIGGPVLIASQEHLADAIFESGAGYAVTILFLVGVAIQVIASLLYKDSMGII